jgi:16S rRNA (cytidine1402-2'-O)-methyltransferase
MTAANRVTLAPGLYFLATPIGTARDITLRALDILASADVLAAEDTRSLRKLMDIHGIALEGRSVISYHDHNGEAARPKIIAALEAGKSVGYASEAGTPLIADPGFQLGRLASEAGHLVTSAPGPSAVIAALTISGLATDRFHFAGFAPNAAGARRSFLEGLKDVEATLVLYESPKRIHKSLRDVEAVMGPERQIAVARELTKKFEEVLKGSVAEVQDQIKDRTLKGEIVVMIARAEPVAFDENAMRSMLEIEMKTRSLKDAVAAVAESSGQPRRKVYQTALDMEKND